MNMRNSKPKPEATELTKIWIWKQSSLVIVASAFTGKNPTFKVRSLTSSGRGYKENYFLNFLA